MRLVENVLKNRNFVFSYRSTTTDRDGFAMFHAHQGLEFLYVRKGKGHIIIDRELVPIRSNTLYCFQPYQLHRVNAIVSPDNPYIRDILVIEPLVMEAFLTSFPVLHTFFNSLWKEKLPVQVFHMGDGIDLNDILAKELQQAESEEQRLEAVALGLSMLLRQLRYTADNNNNFKQLSPRETSLTERAMKWLNTHYQDEFTLSRISGELHVSPSYLSHLFKKDTGNSMTEYIIARRLREACILLRNTEHAVEAVAERVGFTGASHFIHIFKKHIGITPLKYRKNL